ncbi:unnamed protein product [Brassicogethes aeneus]|uniref:Uncharacterized protein n=1 Tax=Brassicogethes aeneus TaxID=1431903 RepID=A0A9P0FF72_BRAAE|nr:unnamed protein product [Brassicogethes aeneus]
MCARRTIVLLVYFLIAFLAGSLAKGYLSDKRAQAGSFKTMMRYGRSNSKNFINPGKDGKYYKVIPRAEAFHIMSRYGKRSSWSPNSSLVYPVPKSRCIEGENLSCSFTGISNFYRCNVRKEPTTNFDEA